MHSDIWSVAQSWYGIYGQFMSLVGGGRGEDMTIQLTHELDPSHQRLLTPAHVLGVYVCFAHHSQNRSCLKDTALREGGGVETFGILYMIEPS